MWRQEGSARSPSTVVPEGSRRCLSALPKPILVDVGVGHGQPIMFDH
jgi:hypothetical protein